MTDYIPTVLKREITVESVVSVHYLEHAKNYAFKGESHDFWELVYVDKGQVREVAEDVTYEMLQGQMIFHKPNEYHNLMANGTVAPNVVIVSFVSHSPAMAFFENKVMYATQQQRKLLSNIINEARQAFSCPLGDPMVPQLTCDEAAPFGSQQMVGLVLEQLLIDIVRSAAPVVERPRVASSVKQRADNEMTERVIRYMEEHLCENLSFSTICVFSAQSATNLKTVFKSVTGMGVMEYYRHLKIERAKQLLREGCGNITQIADRLGYTSVHYFSRHFKQATGMTPREYTQSVQAH
ncbi:MAG: helix-turn-helix domain-containing protein [Clostridia bacterium]|nr:helix-turn-helix domain-containing protein [Clostridia bacterium]